MDDNQRREVRGRLLLWESAIHECRTRLRLVARARCGAQSPDRVAQEIAYLKAFRDYERQQPDYRPGTQLLSHLEEFRASHPEAFPSIPECFLISDYCALFAVVLFCQLFVSGNRHTGRAAKNRDRLMDDLRDQVLRRVFREEVERARFEALKDRLVKVRDKMLGHADAQAFDVRHGDGVIAMNMHARALEGLDLEYWTAILEPLSIAVREYGQQLQ